MKLKAIFLAGLLCAFSAAADDIKSTNMMSEDELVAAAERLIAQEKEAAAATAKADSVAASEEAKPIKKNLNESQIPAFRGSEKPTQATSSPWARLILGAGVVLTLALGLLLGAKRFGKRAQTQKSKISLDIVSQKAISPKQNLLVVRVAGEHILIGATDSSINLIKSVSLIDDEDNNSLPQDFNNFLEDDFVEQPISDQKRRTFTL